VSQTGALSRIETTIAHVDENLLAMKDFLRKEMEEVRALIKSERDHISSPHGGSVDSQVWTLNELPIIDYGNELGRGYELKRFFSLILLLTFMFAHFYWKQLIWASPRWYLCGTASCS
jgi:hypothetical protein